MQRIRRNELPSEDVWCVTTEHGSWIARQNGVITLTGNSKVYGAGLNKFAMTAKTDLESATQFLANYDMQFPGVRRFQNLVNQVINQRAREDSGIGWVTTPAGRRHPCSPDEAYKACNYLIQGTAADVFKRALVQLDLAGVGQYIVLPVHDEVLLDVPDDVIDEVEPIVKEAMQDLTSFAVPLTVDGARYEESWGQKYAE